MAACAPASRPQRSVRTNRRPVCDSRTHWCRPCHGGLQTAVGCADALAKGHNVKLFHIHTRVNPGRKLVSPRASSFRKMFWKVQSAVV